MRSAASRTVVGVNELPLFTVISVSNVNAAAANRLDFGLQAVDINSSLLRVGSRRRRSWVGTESIGGWLTLHLHEFLVSHGRIIRLEAGRALWGVYPMGIPGIQPTACRGLAIVDWRLPSMAELALIPRYRRWKHALVFRTELR